MKTPLHGWRRSAVIVLGDLGRSPRMVNHALELARSGTEVELVGLDGTPVASAVRDHPRIRMIRLRAFDGLRARRGRLAFAVLAAARQLLLAAQLAFVLVVRLRRIDTILVQNPPAFPALPLLLAHRWWQQAWLVVDWHQTTAAMLELRLRRNGAGGSHFVAWLSRLEATLARRADDHLCVSDALREHLARRWQIAAVAVADRAPARFAPQAEAGARRADATLEQPAVVVAPSGWSEDDDFDLLFEAVRDWDELLSRRGDRGSGPRARFVLTGRGERRAQVEARLRAASWRRIEVHTAWYPPDEYPAALAGADLGLSLHASAGGLDVPIKLCELLACGVPVLCLDYGPAVRERIRDGVNGRLFASAAELTALLDELLGTFPQAPSLARLRAGVRAEPLESWESAWPRSVLPLLARASCNEPPTRDAR